MKIRVLLFAALFLLMASVQVQAQDDLQVITPDNAPQLQEIARYGDGVLTGALAWSPDGNTLAMGSSLSVIVYENETQRLLSSEWVENLTFNSDGRLLAAVGRGNLWVWDTQTWEQIADIIISPDFQTLPFTFDYQDEVAFSLDGTQLAVGSDAVVNIYDTTNFHPIHMFTLRRDAHVLTLTYQLIETEPLPILVVDFETNQSGCGEGALFSDWQAFSTDDFTELNDVDYDAVHPAVVEPQMPDIPRPDYAVLSSLNPTWVGIVTQEGTQWQDVITEESVTPPTYPPLPAGGHYFYNTTHTAAAQVLEGEVVFWRRRDASSIDLHLDTFDLVRPPYFSPDGHIIVLRNIPSEREFRFSVNLYDVDTGDERHLFDFQGVHSDAVMLDRLELSRENDYALTLEGSVTKLWDTRTGEIVMLPEDATLIEGIEGADYLNEEQELLAYQIDYAWGDYKLGIFNLNTNEPSGVFQLQNAYAMSYFFDAQWTRLVMVGVSNYDCQTSMNDIEIWDTETQSLLHTWHLGELETLRFNADETLLIGGTVFGDVVILDAVNGQELITLHGHQGVVREAYITDDGTHLLTEGGDGTVRVWGVPAS